MAAVFFIEFNVTSRMFAEPIRLSFAYVFVYIVIT